jgi:pimeloyl-ACP methyl ester carboxylesterase
MSGSGSVRIDCGGREVDIEYKWLYPERTAAPLLVFLHEGLGSVSAWRDYPRSLCEAGGYRGLLYSREGYGRSTPRAAGERWPPNFMHRQAQEALPALLQALGIDTVHMPPWLFGHSDGGSIALIYAASFPNAVAGVIALAPHIMVEDISVESIRKARQAYRDTDLRERLARHHADPDSAFYGWNDMWLDSAFRGWDLRLLLRDIHCPVLAVQGEADEYGSMAQIDGIAGRVPQARLLKLADCGHAPQRDQPQRLNAEVLRFIAENSSP